MESQVIQTWAQFSAKCYPISEAVIRPIIDQYFLSQTPQNEKIALLRQFVTTIADVYDKLLKSNEKLHVMFFDFVKDQFKESAIQILEQEKFSMLLFQYDNFFLGKPKQLLVYKKNYDLQVYLSKYKLNHGYSQMKGETIDPLVESLIRKKKQMNVKFSLDEDYKEAQKEYLDELKKFQKGKKRFVKLMNELLDHFKSQTGRYKFTVKAISVLYKDEIQKIVEEKELYYSEVLVFKSDYQLDIMKPGKYLERENDRREERQVEKADQPQKEKTETGTQSSMERFPEPAIKVESKEGEKSEVLETKGPSSNQPTLKVEEVPSTGSKVMSKSSKIPLQKSQPPKVSGFQLVKSQYGQVQILFSTPTSSNCPITHYNIYKIYGEELKKVQEIPHVENQLTYQCTLDGFGYTQFTIKAQNSNGQSLRHQRLEIIIPSRPNYKLFMKGDASNSMIPGTQDQYVDELDIKMNCSQVEVSSCVMIRDSQGNIATWGKVYCDETEDNVVLEPSPPFQIEIKHINKISCSEQFYLCSDILGRAYGFGKNTSCQLGIPKLKGIQTLDPVQIPYFKQKQIFVTDIACRGEHSIALDSKGNVYSWGANEVGPSGYPICDAFKSVKNFTNFQQKDVFQCLPRLIQRKAFGGRRVIKIAIGEEFACAINEDNELYSWGNNNLGQLGLGQIIVNHVQYSNILCPALVPTFNKDLKVIDVSLGLNHCLAIGQQRESGEQHIYSWGNSVYGACGHEQNKTYYYPVKLEFFKSHKIQFVRAYQNTSFVKTDQGLYQFGIQQSEFTQTIQKLKRQWVAGVVDVVSNGSVDAFLVKLE